MAGDGPRVRVLGIAQDGGVPHPGCTCRQCEAARSDPERSHRVASLGIVDPRRDLRFLIDATPDVTAQLHALRDPDATASGAVDRAPLDGVLLTHAHVGHYVGLSMFGFEAVHTRGLPVWASERMVQLLAGNAPWDQLIRLGNVELRVASPAVAIALTPEIRATPLLVPHRDEYTDTFAWLIEGPARRVLWVPDSAPWAQWEPSLPDRLAAERVDVALLDGTFHSGAELPGRDLSTLAHPLMLDTMDLLEPIVRAGLEVHFVHLNHSNPALDPDGPERAEVERRGFRVASEGLELPL